MRVKPLGLVRRVLTPQIRTFSIFRGLRQQPPINYEAYDPMQGALPKPLPPKGERPVTVEFEFPDVEKERRKGKSSFIAFCMLMGISFFGIIKYEEANSPVVSSTLYTLRRSPKGREVFGDNIQFASLLPWVNGQLSAGKGIVDFEYSVKGEKGAGKVHFHSVRDPYINKYVVQDWSIIGPDGQMVSLMEEDYHPFVPGGKEEPTAVKRT
jgi:cytochrome c oxidase assembly factor 1